MRAFLGPDDMDVDAFAALLDRTLAPADVPHASAIEHDVPIYDMGALRPALEGDEPRLTLMGEWTHVLGEGAGVIVLRRACGDTAPVDRATALFEKIIAEEKRGGSGRGDHFAASGANDRVWNAAQKHCLRDPEGFALYYGNPALAAAAECWLGPHYQLTAQVNLVRPGGRAQTAHRDYHLGFQTAAEAARFPAHAHAMSAALTLQGAVAHCDMPVESGPTKLLPFSQLYEAGYLAFHDAAHRDLFERRCVQVPLRKGDAVFFNPALFHAAGENRTPDVERMANLLQISSAFGRAMEALDRDAMARALMPALARLRTSNRMSEAEADAAIAAAAEGYSFPTNLDTDPPTDGIAPPTQAALMRRALAEDWSPLAFDAALRERAVKRTP